MANYKSKHTGKTIDGAVDNVLNLLKNKHLESVVGAVARDSEGYFYVMPSLTAAEDGTDSSLVTTGEKYVWNHITDDIINSIGQPNGIASLDGNAVIIRSQLPFLSEAQSGTDKTVITTGEKYVWNHLLDIKGQASGLAELDANGHVPAAQLPSYVDDVIEVSSYSALPSTGETGKIYVTLDTNLTYRWSGTAYVEISKSLALGETDSTAYRGDRGKIAYDHAVSEQGAAYQLGLYKFATGVEGHVTNAVAVQWSDLSGLGAISGGYNDQSAVTISPTTTSVYSIDSVGSTNTPTEIDTSKFSGGSLVFVQDANDATHFDLTYTAASLASGFYTPGTAAIMPTRSNVSNLWNGYDTENTFAAAQTFHGTQTAPVES